LAVNFTSVIKQEEDSA